MEKLVYIIILNWNGWQDTVDCVESCLKLNYPNFHILIVDNGSTDDSDVVLREKFPTMDFIQTGANLGFAGGNNVGIRHALDRSADYLWLLNNDTVVDPEALSELVRVIEGGPKRGAVGSKIFYYDQPGLLWFAGGGIRELSKISYHIGAKQRDSDQFQEDRPVDFITGCSFLIRRQALEEAGLMREEFFLYCEDTDWTLRLHSAGWETWWAANSRIWHKVSSSHGERNPFLNYYCVRNTLQYVRLNDPVKLPFTLAVLFKNYVVMKLVQRDIAAIRWAFVGCKDFVFGNLGRYEP